LASAADASINQTLNNRLNRSEFMPFAPVVTEEAADDYFQTGSQGYASSFMTIVSPVSAKGCEQCPGVVHVDGTARPQIISRSVNPEYHDIVRIYGELTGTPVLVNTSFNLHEEPIIESPESAIESFMKGNLDYLALGPYLVNHPHAEQP
jgi:carbamoyltransferase